MTQSPSGKDDRSKTTTQDLCRFFEKLPVPAWVFDKQTFRFLAVNDAAISAYGYTYDEFLSMTIENIHLPEDIANLAREIDKRMFGKHAQQSVWRHRRKNGEEFYVCISTVLTSDKNITVVANDISDTMEAQQQRNKFLHCWQQSHNDFDVAMAEVNEVAWAIRADTRELLYANDATTHVFGYTAVEMMSDKHIFFDSVHEDDRYIVETWIERTIREGRSITAFRVYHKDGTIKHLVGNSFLKTNAKLSYDVLAGFATDVTDQKMLEDRMLNEERKLTSIINNTDDLIWSMDVNLKITEYNEAFRRRIEIMTGKSVNEISQSDFCLKTFSQWEELFTRALMGEKINIVYESYFNCDVIFEETVLNPIFGNDDTIIGISCFTRDVTQKKKYINEIETQNKRFQDIAWLQSHKVRSHVATLLGLQPLLDCDHPENPDNKIIMEGINKELLELDQVIREINDITCNLRVA